MAHSPQAPPSGKNAIFPWRFRFGNPNLCIQCGKCSFVCPHAVIREKVYEPNYLENAPEGWNSTDARWKEFPGMKYTLSVAPEDCTGCGLCIEACPAKDKSQVGRKAINMAPSRPSGRLKRSNGITS